MKRPENNEIVAGYNKKETEAFELIYQDCKAAIFELGLRILKNEEDARDLTVDMFWKMRLNTQSEHNLQAIYDVVYVTARNMALDWLRKRRSEKKYIMEQYIVLSEISDGDMFRNETGAAIYYEINRCKQKLPRQTQRVFDLYFLHQKSISEIAEELNIDTKTVSNNKYEALKVMRLEIIPRKIYVFILNILT